jgi:hypothetical protein
MYYKYLLINPLRFILSLILINFMQTKFYLFCTVVFFFCVSVAFSQNISGKMKVANYTFFYQATPVSVGKYEFTVKNIEKADTDNAAFVLVYSSQINVLKAENNVKETRIYAANRNGVSWTVSLEECLRLQYNYQTQTIHTQVIGTELPKYASGKADKLEFSKDKLTETIAVQTIAQQFINRYYKIFDLGKSPKSNTTAIIAGSINSENGKTYSYEVLEAGFGQQELAIRHASSGLVYKTSLAMDKKANFVVQILYAKRKDVSWEIYGSDVWEMNFDRSNGKGICSKSSLFFPPIPQKYQETIFKNSATETELLNIAVEYFILSYNKLF